MLFIVYRCIGCRRYEARVSDHHRRQMCSNCGNSMLPIYLHYACFTCRKCFSLSLTVPHARPCPHCRGKLVEMGKGFKPPPRSDLRAWKTLGLLRPARLWFEDLPLPAWRDLHDYIARHTPHSRGEHLLARIEQAAGITQHRKHRKGKWW
jgi:DNA-directed RNA polymerase subunit RPC12/RpoP